MWVLLLFFYQIDIFLIVLSIKCNKFDDDGGTN